MRGWSDGRKSSAIEMNISEEVKREIGGQCKSCHDSHLRLVGQVKSGDIWQGFATEQGGRG
jgi:hypothetical protein